MTRNEITVKFAELVDRAEAYNHQNRGKRFWPIQTNRNGKLFEFGMYDGSRKKYVLGEVTNNATADQLLNEIETMIGKRHD